MKLDPSQWRAISDLLDQALELREPERTAWLDALGGQDAALQPLLREILAQSAGAETGDFIDTLPHFEPVDSTAGIAAGALVGPYRLLRELGRGGMGYVWLAERADGLLRRQVALKLPLISLSRGALAERFARERELLAPLAHPHIARLYDAGFAADGQPFLALEFVDGVPLTRHADAQQLSVEARLALFQQVLQAVAYAHANLVLHRDLKPSNILVTPQGEVKLLDFGIAKLLEHGSTVETELTRLGGQALTLDYASPEQITGAPLTTAADVYSLGVVLYELLTGERPYRLKRGTRGELEEAIVAIDAPPPSRVSVSTAAATARRSTAPKLRRALSGDLDTIVQKALAKRPEQRYSSASVFSEDLQRYGAGLPILARPASAWYRSTRFVRRHALAVSATAIVAVALMSFAIVSVVLMQRAERAAAAAKHEATVATAVQKFLTDLFRTNTLDQRQDKQVRDMTAAELLDRGAVSIDRSLDDAPAAKASLLQLFGEMFEELGLPERSLRMHEKSVDAAAKLYGQDSRELALALLEKAWVANLIDRSSDAPLKLVMQAKEILAAKAPGTEDYAEALYMESHLVLVNDPKRAVATGEEAVKIIERLGASDKRAAFAKMELAQAYRFAGDLPNAARANSAAITDYERLFGPDHSDVGALHEDLAIVLLQQLRLREAENNFLTAIAIKAKYPAQRSKAGAFYRLQYALLLTAQGRYAEAYSEADAVEALRKNVTDGFALPQRQVQVVRALMRFSQGDADRGLAEIKSASTDASAFPRRSMVTMSVVHEYLARGYLLTGDTANARHEVDLARAGIKGEGGLSPPRALWLALREADVTAHEGRPDLGLTLLDDAVSQAGIAATNVEAQTQIALHKARIQALAGDHDSAIRTLKPWLDQPLPEGVDLPPSTRGEMLLVAGEALMISAPATARQRLLEAEGALKANDVASSPRLVRVRNDLAHLRS